LEGTRPALLRGRSISPPFGGSDSPSKAILNRLIYKKEAATISRHGQIFIFLFPEQFPELQFQYRKKIDDLQDANSVYDEHDHEPPRASTASGMP
jgi:hypothetical protein